MPTIKIPKYASIEVEHGSNLMQALLAAQLPVASSCNGDGVCGKCKVQILQNADQLSVASELEQQLCQQNSIGPDWRISCQTQVLGDVELTTNYW